MGRKPLGPPQCHPDRPYCAKGLCKSCYNTHKRKETLARREQMLEIPTVLERMIDDRY